MDKFKKLFAPPIWVLALVSLSFPALVGIFTLGCERSLWAVPFYVVSAYALAADCLRLIPALGRRLGSWMKKEPASLRRDLVQNLLVSLAYGGFNLAMGIYQGSGWLVSNALYYIAFSLIYGILLHYHRHLKTGDGWQGYILCGWCLLGLNLTMSGIVFQMIWRGEGEYYPGLLVYGAAAYTFYKLAGAILQLIKSRHSNAPLLGAARNLGHTEALMSLFSLQTALFASFGQDFPHQHLMNTLTGTGVCLLTVLGAVGMILHGNCRRKEEKQ